MTNDEMIATARLLLDFEKETRDLQKEIDSLRTTQNRAKKNCHDQRNLLLPCVGANVTERIIPIGDKAIIITYNPPSNELRISNRVVTPERS